MVTSFFFCLIFIKIKIKKKINAETYLTLAISNIHQRIYEHMGITKGTYDSSTERKASTKVHEINDQNGNTQGLF